MMNFLKIALWIILAMLVAIGGILWFKTVNYPFGKLEADSGSYTPKTTDDLPIRRFSKGLQYPTVINSVYENTDFSSFIDFRLYLQSAYPEVFEVMEYKEINGHAMLLTWKGKQTDLLPVVFLSHYDVVPAGAYDPEQYLADTSIFQPKDKAIPPAAEVAAQWEYGPFSGAVTAGRIYGRGAIDMKCMLFGLLEAASRLIKEGFVPERDYYFAFGHDEEVGGQQGATEIAKYLLGKNIRFDAVYDEGGIVVTAGSVGLVEKDMALIGLAEKGFSSVRIKVKGEGGHSSMPTMQTALGKAAVIMQRLEENQMQARLITPIENFLQNIGGGMSTAAKVAIANQWLMGSSLLNTLAQSPVSNALIRTTTALTMAKGSEAANVLAPVAEIVVNFRLLPGDTSEDVLRHVAALCEGFEVELEQLNVREASNISPTDSRGYEKLHQNIRRFFPSAIITPYISVGGTDAYKYEQVSDNVYRFLPIKINSAERQSMHNYNEYISIENYLTLIDFFEAQMAQYDQ